MTVNFKSYINIITGTMHLAILCLFCAVVFSDGAPSKRVSWSDGMTQILIPSGNFTMGAEDEEGYGRTAESPPHSVYLDEYWIDKYEVSNEQFATFLNKKTAGNRRMIYQFCNPGSPFCRITVDKKTGYCSVEPGYERHPVCSVSINGAKEYAKSVRRRLPTEAEWEKAARGTDGRKYPWGNKWMLSNVNTSETGKNITVPCGSIAGDLSPYGVSDMAGNASEWVIDFWDIAYYMHSPSRNPVNGKTSQRGVSRGGSWCLTEWDARTTSRHILFRSSMRRYMGFRCAETVMPALPKAVSVSKDVLFYAPMDGYLNAAFARGHRRPLFATKDILYKKGHRGKAALLGEVGSRRFSVDYIATNNFNIKEGTLSLWIQPNGWNVDTTGYRYFFMIRDELHCRFYLLRSIQGPLSLFIGNGIYKEWGAISTPVNIWEDEKWTHLAVTWTIDRIVTLYVNGKQVGKVIVPKEKYIRGVPDVFSLGQSQQWSKDGKRAQTAFDEIVIFDRAFTPAEIVKEMNRKSIP